MEPIHPEVQTAICTGRTIDRLSGKIYKTERSRRTNPPGAITRGRYLIIIFTSGKNHFHEMNGDVGMAGWK